ncbi:hypothetical protein C8J35_102146 [Rhizobium sp. PP-F2F-G38]|nr:hypothetical protein C8J37_102147 [Rhizobium sp. PP-WC-1G-195]PYE99258.1 hypothetical protein C8J35_102146 [Rhizobium sp. PP-F2F-G38]
MSNYRWRFNNILIRMSFMREDAGDLEFRLLGLVLYTFQKIEFGLYGIAAHLSHLPEAQNDRRLASLTGEKFLRGDPRQFKVTFGQLVAVFSDVLMLSSPELHKIVENRNIIIHNYYRKFHTKFSDSLSDENKVTFLEKVLIEALEFLSVLQGLFVVLKEAAAKKEGRVQELVISDEDRQNRHAYFAYVARHHITPPV